MRKANPVDSPVCFLDTETTSLRPDRRAWDIAIIRREPSGVETEFSCIVYDIDLTDADPHSLRIGRFHERHPRFGGDPGGSEVLTETDAAHRIEQLVRGAHLVGVVPDFDAHTLRLQLTRHNLPWSAHYHLIDCGSLALGWLASCGKLPERPWRSEELSRAVGVEPPAGTERHTALGDARWARRIYDTVLRTDTTN